MPALRRPAPARAAALLLAAAALSLTGCSATNPVTTNQAYAASDGVDITLGGLQFGNLLVLSAEQGAPGTVLGSVTNTAGADVRLEIGLSGELTTLAVPAGETVLLGPDDAAVDLATVPSPPGALVEVVMTSDADGSATVMAPVLDGTLEQYAALVPQP
ncbi:hypothetical protein [Actinotalea sp.]|uniref:hypothetical protein n=1 Tax=Actinotalea sp. TaxID=1872145 RepID=UPI003564AA9E